MALGGFIWLPCVFFSCLLSMYVAGLFWVVVCLSSDRKRKECKRRGAHQEGGFFENNAGGFPVRVCAESIKNTTPANSKSDVLNPFSRRPRYASRIGTRRRRPQQSNTCRSHRETVSRASRQSVSTQPTCEAFGFEEGIPSRSNLPMIWSHPGGLCDTPSQDPKHTSHETRLRPPMKYIN